MVECVSLFCEILAILFLMHSLLQKKMVLDKKVVALLVVDVCILYLINVYIFPAYLLAIVYAVLFWYIKAEFSDDRIGKIAVALICTLFILGGIEVVIYCILQLLHLFQNGVGNDYIANVGLLICTILLTKWFDLGKLYQYIMKVRYGIGYIIFGCGLLTVCLMIFSKLIGSKFSTLEMVLISAIFLIVVISFRQWKTQRDMIALQERQVNWLAQCNDSFQQLITDVRAKQHEFNNQLDAICGMQYSCKTYGELVEQLNRYTDRIFRESRFNKLLTMDCPPIIKGFLYYRFCKADEEGFAIDYRIALDSETDFPLLFDIAEIVGILFDNACEAVREKGYKKQVCVGIKPAETGIHIVMENPSSYISYQETALFTKKGYSSKGTARGYGLYNVRKLAKKYNGDIAFCNMEKAGENWLQISVTLPD